MKPIFKAHNAHLVNYLFQTLLVTYLVLLLAEQVWSGIVSQYLNLNYLLVAVIIAGVLDVFSEHEEKKSEKVKRKDYLLVFILGILGFAIIKYKTSQLGWLSWLISIVAGILIILLSLLVLEDEDEEKETQSKQYKSHFKPNALKLKVVSGIIIVMLLLSFALSIFTNLSVFESLRIVFGSVYVLFLPGFIISYIFFPETKQQEKNKNHEIENNGKSIDWIERVALSFALSIAIVPLAVFYLNLIGVKISLLNSFLTILAILAASGIILYFRKKQN